MVELIRTYKIHLKRQFVRKNKKKEKDKWFKFRKKIKYMLFVAKKIANYVIKPENRKLKITSKTTKQFGGLKSTIASQIIRKYKNNKKCKKISNVNLIIPAHQTKNYDSVKYDINNNDLFIVPLKLHLKWNCPTEFIKINQVELNLNYVYVCVTINTDDIINHYENVIGVDLNIKHNLASVGNPETKTVSYLGKTCIYDRLKYKNIRRRFQKQKRPWKVKEMGNKEQRYMNDINHKIANNIVELAKENKSNIAFENLSGIRKAKVNKNFKYFLNSWSFYTLQTFVEHKSEMEGIKVVYVDPKFTSQICSNCGEKNKCSSKKYVCQKCKLHIHRDENASYNIGNRGKQSLSQTKLE